MIEGIEGKIKCVAQFVKDMDGFSASTGTGYQRHTTPYDIVGSCQIFLSRKEMQEIADKLGVGLQSHEHSEYEDWIYFIYDGVDFGCIAPKEEHSDE